MNGPSAEQLLVDVRRRLWLAMAGRSGLMGFLAGCGVATAVLLVARFAGVGTELATWPVLVGIVVAGGLIGLVARRPPTQVDAARRVDAQIGGKDLFLTLCQLSSSAGEYQPLVLLAAEQRAGNVTAARIVPFAWQNRYWNLFWPPALVLLGMLYLPQFDPFGRVAEAKLDETRAERLKESRKATQLRLAEVKEAAEEGEESDPTQQAIKDLQHTFNRMKPKEKLPNLKQLLAEQKRLGEAYRRISEDSLKELLKKQAEGDQMFGGEANEQLKKWSKELSEGSAEAVKQEMQQMQDLLQELSKTEDPVKKQELEQKLKEKLDNLERLANEEIGSEKLAAALERAKQQLDMSQLDELSQEALESLAESLDLAEAELQEIAQAAKDLKSLEQALKTLQQAKRLNDYEMLDGDQAGNCKCMADYEELYAQMMAKMKDGDGNGLGGEGIGEGGEAPEDDSIETSFRNEQSKSPTTAGKVILSMKTKGVGETGEVVKQYRELITTVKQGVSEAILQEQVPPGYHDGIKGYFDALEAPAEKK